jgi:hypothetical protein
LAAPTNVRVESNSITTTTLNWTYGGSTDIAVFRSTDGSSYSEATTGLTRIVPGTTTFTDVGLATATMYWYKLSDDGGSTFSSVVTVVTQTCGISPGQPSDVTLPRAGEDVTGADFNDLAQRVENQLVKFISPDGATCVACITDNALVIDCVAYANCDTVQVVVDANINSISMPNCDNSIKQIDFIIPPGTTRQICGWPGGGGFAGDECFNAPIVGGTTGRTYSVGTAKGKAKSGNRTTKGYPPPPKGGPGGARGGSACTCVPNGNGALTIKSCNANNSMDCSSTKSLTLKACGGRSPYTWSHSGSVSLSKTSGDTTVVTPPTNTGSGVAGTAYTKYGGQCTTGAGVATTCPGADFTIYTSNYGCNDQVLAVCTAGSDVLASGNCTAIGYNLGLSACAAVTPCHDAGTCTYGSCDARSGAMIASGCVPCGVNAGSTVSVTDALGTVATIILRA